MASYYEPHVSAVLRWLLPIAALAWVVVSGLGRSLLLAHAIQPRQAFAFRPLRYVLLQAVWLCLLH